MMDLFVTDAGGGGGVPGPAFDAVYLRLDATNDPLTGTLTAQALEFAAHNTYPIGTNTVRPSNTYLQRLSVGDKATLTIPGNNTPAIFDFQRSSAATLQGMRILTENQNVGFHSRPLFLQNTVNNPSTPGGVCLEVARGFGSGLGLSTVDLDAAIKVTETYPINKVSTAAGVQVLLDTPAGLTTALYAIQASASGASVNNWAFYASSGDIVIGYGRLNMTDGGICNPIINVSALSFEAGTSTIQKGAGTVQNQNLLDKTAAETISGLWTKTTADFVFNDNIAVALGTASTARLYSDGFDCYIVCPTIRLRGDTLVLGASGGTTTTIYMRNSLSPILVANADGIRTDDALGLGAVPIPTYYKVRLYWDISTDPPGYMAGENADIIGSGTTYSANVLTAIAGNAKISTGAANAGRNFRDYVGVSTTALFSGTQDVTWSAAPTFKGGDFTAGYTNTGVLTGGSGANLNGGFFSAVVTANPNAAMTMDTLHAARFVVYMTGCANMTVNDSAAIALSLTYAGTVTRAYGILIPAASGSPGTLWGINSALDIQIASDTKLILEGSGVTKGDSYFTFVSASNRIDAYVNGTAEMGLSANLLDVLGDVRGRQLVADGDNAGIASTVSFTKTIAAVAAGAGATLGTIGGGPAGAGQSHWLKIYDGATARYIPVWT